MNDLGNFEEPALRLRSVFQSLLGGIGTSGLIGTVDILHVEHMARRVDFFRIEGLQFFNVAEDRVKILGEFFLLGWRKEDTRELGDLLDIQMHQESFWAEHVSAFSHFLHSFLAAGLTPLPGTVFEDL